jgi:serine protease inhibitor
MDYFLFVQGTEAAAATSVDARKRRKMASERKSIEFKVDRPFYFLIRECQEKCILFSGRCLSIPV